MKRRTLFLGGLTAACAGLFLHQGRPVRAEQPIEAWAKRLIEAATAQVGVTVIYDPSYSRIDFPNGDVPRERGVCTDVVIRAYRDAFGIDLQRLVNDDMRAAFPAYPKTWGLSRPDRNIDHRRVPNLERFLERKGAAVPVSDVPDDYLPGDLVTQRLPGGLPHIGIVSDARSSFGGTRPLLVHNIGAGARIEDVLFGFRIVGHFRFPPAA